MRRSLAREFRRQLGQVCPEEKPKGWLLKCLGRDAPTAGSLTRRIMEVMYELNLAADLEHVTDIKEIASFGVMGSPALLINGKVLSVGTVPSKKQLADWLKQAGV